MQDPHDGEPANLVVQHGGKLRHGNEESDIRGSADPGVSVPSAKIVTGFASYRTSCPQAASNTSNGPQLANACVQPAPHSPVHHTSRQAAQSFRSQSRSQSRLQSPAQVAILKVPRRHFSCQNELRCDLHRCRNHRCPILSAPLPGLPC